MGKKSYFSFFPETPAFTKRIAGARMDVMMPDLPVFLAPRATL